MYTNIPDQRFFGFGLPFLVGYGLGGGFGGFGGGYYPYYGGYGRRRRRRRNW